MRIWFLDCCFEHHLLPFVLAMSASRPCRDWVSTRVPAEALNISPTSLQRRTRCDHWRRGVHYRWVRTYSRSVLQFNLPKLEALLHSRGW